MSEVADYKGLDTLHISLLTPSPLNPRRVTEDGALRSLAESIRTKGMIEPLLVRPARGGGTPGGARGWEVVCGERRLAAARLAGLTAVPVTFRRNLSDQEALELILIENLQREDLNPLEEAEGFQRLQGEFGYTQRELGKALNRSQVYISNTVSLLRLPREVQEKVRSGAISRSHAEHLTYLAEDAEAVRDLAGSIEADGLTIRQLVAEVNSRRQQGRVRPLRRKRNNRPKGRETLSTELFSALREWTKSEFIHNACTCEHCERLRALYREAL